MGVTWGEFNSDSTQLFESAKLFRIFVIGIKNLVFSTQLYSK